MTKQPDITEEQKEQAIAFLTSVLGALIVYFFIAQPIFRLFGIHPSQIGNLFLYAAIQILYAMAVKSKQK